MLTSIFLLFAGCFTTPTEAANFVSTQPDSLRTRPDSTVARADSTKQRIPALRIASELTLSTGYSQSNYSEAPGTQFIPWNLAGNVTLTSRSGWVIPVGVVWSSRPGRAGQPDNQMGASPCYQNWLTLHGGYRSVYFSPLTLAGHLFLGAGVEINQKLLRLGAVYGQFNRAVESRDTDQMPAFRRMGYSFKAGIGTAQNYVDVILLNVADDPHSIKTEAVTGVSPAENRALGISARLRLRKVLYVEFDAAGSAYTPDMREPAAVSVSNPSWAVYARFLSRGFTPRVSTQWRTALQTSLTYKLKQASIKLDYKRIEPDYRTLGTYFVQSDIERLLAVPSVRCLNNRLTLRASLGLQRNSLFGQKKNSTHRLTNSLNASYSTDDNLTLDLSYSNYGLTQRAGYQPLNDTVRLAQNNRTFSANGFKMWTSETQLHTVMATAIYGELVDLNPFTTRFNQNQNWNYTASYDYQHLTANVNINLTYSYSLTKSPDLRSTYHGPSVTIHKKLLNPNSLDLSLNASYLINRERGAELTQNGNVLNGSLAVGYQITAVHRLLLNWSTTRGQGVQSIQDQQGTIQYSLSF